ncbi:MAG: ATPase [Chlorobi bacterium OLB4]|jgi:Protein of unknown function (DUF1446).|nr:MAG: ATPase [Chlorobi bacterium OLB4]MBW7855057.1 DUF1446 domain-containing protein [Ignavibacteria bacterium]OQY76756.1 MAG: ATPase [Ignavibacteriales bacterium UTCHB1]
MKEKIRIASGQGFWGDMVDAPFRQITEGPVDYLVMDYLAEVTMSILQKQKLRDPKLGYARDIPPLMERILPIVKDKGIKVITNGGGVNPYSCKDAIIEVAKKLGIKGLKIGIVIGDDILNRIDNLLDSGIELKNMETGESIRTVKDKILSANVYLGAGGVVEALQNGADIIMTGRVTDTGLTLAPMIYEFGWNFSDFNLMATGTVAGHILECGGQASGGNFLGDWKSVPELDKIGFPIAEAHPDGTVFITKHDGTGGIVNVATVSEQLVYEIGNPKDYITPDCIADFTSIQLEESGNNRVKVTGVKGQPATEFYKVSMSYLDGYSAFGSLTYCWPDALDKAQAAEEILRKRLDALGLTFDEIKSEFQGYNACHGPLANTPDDPSEIVLRIGVRSHDKKSVERFGMEIAPLILTGPPGVTGFAGGRPKPSEVVAYWPALIPKSAVKYEVEVFDL